MAGFFHAITQSVQSGSINIQSEGRYEGSGNPRIDDVAAADATTRMTIAIDVSAVKSIVLLSDQDVTIKTNNASTPDDELELSAGVAYLWNTDTEGDFVFGTDITAVFVQNAGEEEARIQIDVIEDATP
jgi:hypothetical protein